MPTQISLSQTTPPQITPGEDARPILTIPKWVNSSPIMAMRVNRNMIPTCRTPKLIWETTGDCQGFDDMQYYHIDLRHEGGSILFVSLLIPQVIVSLNVTSRIAST